MIDFEKFFREVTEWQEREFPEYGSIDQYLEVQEEETELRAAIDEWTMSIDSSWPFTDKKVAHETCDLIIASLGLLHKLGYGPEKIVETFEKRRNGGKHAPRCGVTHGPSQ